MSVLCTRDFSITVNPADDPGPVLGFPTAMEYCPSTDRIFMSGYRVVATKYDHGVSIITPSTGAIIKKIIVSQSTGQETNRIYSINYSSVTDRIYIDIKTSIVVFNPSTLLIENTWLKPGAVGGASGLQNSISPNGILLTNKPTPTNKLLIDIQTGTQTTVNATAFAGRSVWIPTRNAFWYTQADGFIEMNEAGTFLNHFGVNANHPRWPCYDSANDNIYGTSQNTARDIVGWNMTAPDPGTFFGYLGLLDLSGDITPAVQFGRPVFCPTNSLTYFPATAQNKLVVIDGSTYTFDYLVTTGETAFNLPIYGVFCPTDGKLYFSKDISTPGFTRVVPI